MRTSGHGAEHADLDHRDWVEDPPRRARSGGDRRATERRGASGKAPARERRSGDRRGAERRSASSSPERTERAPAPQPARRTARRAAGPPATVLGPGVAERRTLMLVTFLLVVYGLVMAYSASAAQAYFEHGSSFYLFGRQVAWVCIGVGAMYVLSRVDYAWFRKAAVPLAGLAFAGLRPRPRARASAAPSTEPAAGSTSAGRACSPASSPSSPAWCSSPAWWSRARERC